MEELLKAKQETIEDLDAVIKEIAELDSRRADLQSDLDALNRIIARVERNNVVVSEERSDINTNEQGGLN